MNIPPTRPAARARGFTLIELLVYIALFAVVVGTAYMTFYECMSNSKALRRNADDIVRALSIGDQWRADIRAATGLIQLTNAPGAEQLRIPAAAGEIVYTLANGELRRRVGEAASNPVWLSNVKSSEMQSEWRGRVPVWRWELELKSVRKEARMRPLFTFESVAGTANLP